MYKKGAHKEVIRRRSMSTRAGILFPCGKFKRNLKSLICGVRIRKLSAIHTAAVLQYLVAEILDLAKEEAVNDKKKRISPRHIFLAVKWDDELNELLSEVIIPQGNTFW